jgi:flavodoxin
MSVCIVYHSETGNTRSVAEQVAAATDADLIEVKDLAGYSKMGMYLKGAPKAMRGEKADIEPSVIDVSGYDTVVLGSPVWGRSPTPAVNAAVAALQGIEGKTAVVFCTCGGMAGKTLETMQTMLAERGATVEGAIAFTERDLRKTEMVDALIDLVRPRAVSST